MSIIKSENKILTTLDRNILITPPIFDFDIEYDYKLNGSNIKQMKNRANPTQTAYQFNESRQPLYNATENAGEVDGTAREIILPNNSILNNQLDEFTIYFKAKFKTSTGNKYILEASNSGSLEEALYFTDNTFIFYNADTSYTFTDTTILTDDYFEILLCVKDIQNVIFVNGQFVQKGSPNLGNVWYSPNKIVLFGNTRLSIYKYDGYFKAFKMWDKALIDPANY